MTNNDAKALILSALFTVFVATDSHAGVLCRRDVPSLISVAAELARENAGQTLIDTDQFMAFADKPNSAVWTFTKPAHPAHPAVVCRYPIKIGERYHVKLEATCGGTKSACDQLIEDFRKLNERIPEDIRQKK